MVQKRKYFDLITKSRRFNIFFEFIKLNHHKIQALICPVAEEFLNRQLTLSVCGSFCKMLYNVYDIDNLVLVT